MSNKKVKVSFDPTFVNSNGDVVNIWNQGDFRDFMKSLVVENSDKIDVYIITEEPETDYIEFVSAELGITEDKVIECSDAEDKIDALEDNQIDIHFDANNSLSTEMPDNTIFILVNYIINHIRTPKWLLNFELWYKRKIGDDSLTQF